MEPRVRASLMLILLLPAVSLACRDFSDRDGSSGLATGPVVDATGIWEGNWATTSVGTPGSGETGTLTVIVDQDADGDISGCSCWVSAACWDDGIITASINGVSAIGKIMEVLRDPKGTVPRIGASNVTGVLDVIGDSMTGTFSVRRVDKRRCTDNLSRRFDAGTLDLTRVGVSADVVGLCADLNAAATCDLALP